MTKVLVHILLLILVLIMIAILVLRFREPYDNIPRIMHKIWMSPKEDGIPTEIPQPWIDWDRHCRQLHPAWRHITWNERTMRDFVQQEIPELLDTYDSYPTWIQRCDAFRYIVLYRMGGVYLDMDANCQGSLDALVRGKHCIVNQPWSNHFMAAEPGHPLFKKCVDSLSNHKGSSNVWDSTGPAFLHKCYDELPNKEKIHLVPEGYIPLEHVSGKTWFKAQLWAWIRKYWWLILLVVILLLFILCFLLWRWRRKAKH